MPTFSVIEIVTIVVLAPIGAFLFIRGQLEVRRSPAESLERLREIEEILQLNKTDPQAAERPRAALEDRDARQLAALQHAAQTDRSAAKALVRELKLRRKAKQEERDFLSRNVPELRDEIEALTSDLARLDAQLLQSRRLR